MPGRHAPAGRATALMCALPVAVLVVMGWRQRWVTDDAFIIFRVVENLGDGHGPVWNTGERIEVYTSPLWTGILWLGSTVLGFVALEWIAVLLGGAATVAALCLAAHGSWLLWRTAGRSGVGLPLGLLVFVALPPVWDFTTSGLETGLTFLWLAGSFWLLALLNARAGRPPGRLPALAAVVIGLGPLVRPDVTIFAVGFMVALFLSPLPERRAGRTRLVAYALLLPVAYQVFRMGYFALLEPNTALAKEAGRPNWSRGWAYLKDLVETYYLWIPLALGAVLCVVELRGSERPARGVAATALVPVVCGLLHALYVVRVGGDFMHGRMLLPSLFGLLLPLALVVPSRRDLRLALALAVVPWAIVCAATLRAPYADRATSGRVVDERAGYVNQSGRENPVTLEDYRDAVWAQQGAALRELAERGRALVPRVAVLRAEPLRVAGEPGASSPTPVVAGMQTIGLAGYAAGPDVHIVDQLGLADPIASRTRIREIRLPPGTLIPAEESNRTIVIPAGYRAGHEKQLPTEWIAARFARVDADRFRGIELSARGLDDARRALSCEDLERLLRAVTRPMSTGRFLSNLRDSFGLTFLRLEPDPSRAARELCDEP